MNWIIDNKEWIFSGIGVFIIGLLITLLRKRHKKHTVTMNQKSGSDSINIQVKGDFKNKK